LTQDAAAAIVPSVTVRHAVTFGPIPYGLALYTCACGASAPWQMLSGPLPSGWLALDDHEHLCPHCAGSPPPPTVAADQPQLH
jgi:hypothetical protein